MKKPPIPNSMAEPAAFEAILDAFLSGLRNSPQNPSIADYERRYPQFADQIATHFPGVLIAEKLRVRPQVAELELELPIKIGKFELTEKIGKGGMGTVFSALHQDLQLEFAIKLIQVSCTNQRQLARFEREAKALATLHHPGITPICDYGQHDDYMYIAMKKVDGITFSQLFAEPTSISRVDSSIENIVGNWSLLAMLFREVAAILAYVHENQLVHRDIKPNNLMIDQNSRVWITDFGLVKELKPDPVDMIPSSVVGTLHYVAPECYDGVVSQQSDVYGLGVTLFELATGVTAASISEKQTDRENSSRLPRTNEVNSNVPQQLAKIIDRTCNSKPAHRYFKAEHVARDLKEFVLRENQGRSLFTRWLT